MKKSFFLCLLLFCGVRAHGEQKKPMKILMVVGTFPKIHDICMLNQITGLIDRGHDVRIFAFYRGDDTQVQQEVITYDLLNKTTFKQLPDSLDEYDIIVFQLGHKLFDIKKTHKFKGKVVVCLRGYDVTGFLQENPHAYDTYFDSCDLFLPVCETFKKILERIGCPLDKIIVHHSAVDCPKFKFKVRKLPRKGPINIVSAGRFVEKKGFIYSIQAIARLIKKHPRIRYTIIGDGALKKTYQKLIKQLHAEKYIKLDGWHRHEEYIDILDKAHIFILPSVVAQNNDQEGIPNVLKEAMAMGLVVIATNHSGNLELIDHGRTGFFVPEHNSYVIATTVEYILNHPDTLLPIQEEAAQKVRKEFDKEKENDKLEAIFYDLLKKNSK